MTILVVISWTRPIYRSYMKRIDRGSMLSLLDRNLAPMHWPWSAMHPVGLDYAREARS